MELTTEYLVIIEKKTSEALFRLCDSIEAFNKFLQSEQDIEISKNRIKFQNKYSFAYRVTTGEIAGKDQRYFHIRLGVSREEDNLDQFIELNKIIKGLVHNAGGQPETLWNDVSLYYSQQAYPYIHRIENLMRKLITYFMLTRVGKEWITETSPSAVREAIDKSKRKQYFDVLYQVDFKHLGDFLFKRYQTKDISELHSKLDTITSVEELCMDELQSFRARSNWDRYFSRIVDCEGAYLDKRWDKLYELRCMVAHNALIGRQDYKTIIDLVNEVEGYLQRALENLGQIQLPEEDKEQIAENVATNISATHGEFLKLWKIFESVLSEIAVNFDLEIETEDYRTNLRKILNLTLENKLIDIDTYHEGKELSEFRNMLVHNALLPASGQDIGNYINRLNNLVSILKAVSKPVSFHNECVKRLEHHFNQPLAKRSRTTYTSKNGKIALTCAISKAHERGGQQFYWFGFHRHQKQFLEQFETSYVSFGCGSEDTLMLIPLSTFSEYLDYMSVTDRDNRYYWHVHITQNSKNYFLQRSGANPIELSGFLLPKDNSS